ncbi:opioid growth factor receptor conserved region-domain-containing protein [Crepidotus variabilis]|uniref:Opioid growth factor receptor conserved region-domain-containing protein n=1 Tax=Crepidotus variabilis TaxID=179855 RepID=A0A9P6JTK4_9AGAR|nr:opioid growth factor receptor conserved region-domain-containing protein [Crepidotus variabilis]
MSIPSDVQEFLDEYPREDDDLECNANLEFYSNTHRCRPDNRTIEEIHAEWFGDYETLEYNHGYIQWLFPIREHGMNFKSQPLQKHELEAMKANPTIIQRILKSYELMLDFYGMHLVSAETGLVDRCQTRNFMPRYRNLVRASHNNLRISRIMKCLSEMGLERLNAGFLLHVLHEQSERENLVSSSIKSSMDRWWANCLRNEHERSFIGQLIRKVRSSGDEYVLTRREYEAILEHRAKTGKLEIPSKVPASEVKEEVHAEAAVEEE